jgi:RNA polymerase sigma-70 factor (ECF subfamily)
MTMPLVASEEINFATRIVAVNPQEFSTTYRLFLPQISKYLVRRVEPSSVEDLASQIFEIAWRKRDQAPKGFELPWLFKIAGFVVANHRRKEAAKTNLILALRPQDSSPSAEEIALSDLGLSEAWAKLSPRERQVISLSSFEGLDNKTAAKVLEISTNAYALRLSKAKTKLKALLSQNL